jgi:hypothetical protein
MYRLTYDELLAFCTHCFGSVPDDVPSIFAEVLSLLALLVQKYLLYKYNSSMSECFASSSSGTRALLALLVQQYLHY